MPRHFSSRRSRARRSLGNALGVIDPVDADPGAAWSPRPSQLPLQLLHLVVHGLARGRGLVLVDIDADGERPHHGHLAAACDFEAFVIDFRFQDVVHRIQEVLAMIAQVEPEQIIGQHPLEQLFFPGKGLERFGSRPGNVPEVGDDQVVVVVLGAARGSSPPAEMVVLGMKMKAGSLFASFPGQLWRTADTSRDNSSTGCTTRRGDSPAVGVGRMPADDPTADRVLGAAERARGRVSMLPEGVR